MNRATSRFLAGKTNGTDDSQWLPLWMHCRDTAGIMSLLVEKWLSVSVINSIGLSETALNQVACFLGYVHDIGKATPIFQRMILPCIPDVKQKILSHTELSIPEHFIGHKTHHARASEAILLFLGCPKGIASVAGAHHGKPQENGIDDGMQDQIEIHTDQYYGESKDLWSSVWKDLLQQALDESGFSEIGDLPELSEQAMLLLTGLLTMADWLASNPQFFPLLSVDEPGNETVYPARIDHAWRIIHPTEPWAPSCFAMDETTFSGRFGFSPNEVQKAVIEIAETINQPGIVILEAPMGSGKTEAALAAAEIIASYQQEGGVFFGLPTQATANGIFPRLVQWAQQQSEETAHSIRLAHGAANYNVDYEHLRTHSVVDQFDEDSGVLVHSWFQGSKRALLSDFVIGTVDQLLMAALKQKHVMLRHLGLAGKVVIVDECHAYDAYMNRYLDRVLMWLGSYRVPVILLSATLPAKRRTDLVAAYLNRRKLPDQDWQHSRGYPLITWTDSDVIRQNAVSLNQPQKEVYVQPVVWEELTGCLQPVIAAGGCAGIVVNTVKKAQELAALLREVFPESTVILCHAQYIMPDRAEKEAFLLNHLGKNSTTAQRERLIIVGTQVIEQSLDIDFDYMVTELCPMDLLLQRIGRLHRHPRKRPEGLNKAVCTILDTGTDDFDAGSKSVYGEWLLWRTRKLLPSVIRLPDDIPQLVQDTYEWEYADRLPETPESMRAKQAYLTEQQIMRQRANQFAIFEPDEDTDSLDDWMNNEGVRTDAQARAAVRDGDPSIEVLLMAQRNDGTVHFLPWIEDGRSVDAGAIPAYEDAGQIARQRLRLPGCFGKRWRIDRVIRELEERNIKTLPIWQKSPLLKGELVLLLDEDLNTCLDGTNLYYTQEDGLTYRKEEDDERKGI